MIIYHHENNHDYIVVLILIVVVDDSHASRQNTDTRVDESCKSSIHDDPGNSFVIVQVTKIAYHIQEISTVLVKNNCRWCVYHDLCKSFLILFSYKNCVYLFV